MQRAGEKSTAQLWLADATLTGTSRVERVLEQLYGRSRRGGETTIEEPAAKRDRPKETVKTEAPSAADRRAFPRRQSRCAVLVHCCSDKEPFNPQHMEWLLRSARLKGWLIDISMNGVAFLVPEPLKPGHHVLLRLANLRLDCHLDAEADVVRVTEDEEGGWKIVCRLRRNLGLEQVVQFGRNLFDSQVI